jgi:hypothetical protein
MEAKKGKISPIFMIILLVGIFLIIRQFVLKPLQEANGNQKTVDTNTGSTTEPTSQVKTPAVISANDKVYEWKNPIMSGDRVRWIQDGYNRYAKNKRLYGPGQGRTGSVAEWVNIPVDGQFGKQTHEAVRRVMTNTAKASWTQFKARLINVNSVNFPDHPIY